jgi:hypothetical protein
MPPTQISTDNKWINFNSIITTSSLKNITQFYRFNQELHDNIEQPGLLIAQSGRLAVSSDEMSSS